MEKDLNKKVCCETGVSLVVEKSEVRKASELETGFIYKLLTWLDNAVALSERLTFPFLSSECGLIC